MPNGFHGSRDDWERLEAPLRSLDPALESFSRRRDVPLSRNHGGWPERSLRWGSPLSRLIQIYLEDEERLTWNLWLCASEDRPSGRYWKRAFLRTSVPIEQLADNLGDLLEESFAIVESWSAQDLDSATDPA